MEVKLIKNKKWNIYYLLPPPLLPTKGNFKKKSADNSHLFVHLSMIGNDKEKKIGTLTKAKNTFSSFTIHTTTTDERLQYYTTLCRMRLLRDQRG